MFVFSLGLWSVANFRLNKDVRSPHEGEMEQGPGIIGPFHTPSRRIVKVYED
jgi:hypothetical protein